MQSRLDTIADQFTKKGDTTHTACVQASSAHLVLQLRADFSEGEEHDLTQAEHDFINSHAIRMRNPRTGIPPEWDHKYPNCRGIFAILRNIFTQPFFNHQQYLTICDNLKMFVAMKKDHYSEKKYFENGIEASIQPSMGEVINLTCHGLLNDEAFEAGTQSLETNRAHRVYSLYQLLLKPVLVCSTGVSNSFLFLLNGYKNIYIVEDVLAFIHSTTLEFVTATLLDEFKNQPEALYQLILSKFDLNGDAYETWLREHAAQLATCLSTRCAATKLNPEESKHDINEIIKSLDDLDIPSDLNPTIIILLKYLLRDYQTERQLFSPEAIKAITAVGIRLNKTKTLDGIPLSLLAEFNVALDLDKKCRQYNYSRYLMIGEEGGRLRKAIRTAQTTTRTYFNQLASGHCEYHDLKRPENFNSHANALKEAIAFYQQTSHEPFVRDFFAILSTLNRQSYVPFFNKMETLREKLQLSDADIEAYHRENLNAEFGEITISPYEMNRFILHALWVNPGEWSPTFRTAFSRVTAWFQDKKDHNQLERLFKAIYDELGLIEHLAFLALLTSEEAPAVTQGAFVDYYGKHKSPLRANYISVMHGELYRCFADHVSTIYAYTCATPFSRKLGAYNLNGRVWEGLLKSRETSEEQRHLIIEMLLIKYLNNLFLPDVYISDAIARILFVVQNNPRDNAYANNLIQQHGSEFARARDYIRGLLHSEAFSQLSNTNKECLLALAPESSNAYELFMLRSFYLSNHPQKRVLLEKTKQCLQQGAIISSSEFVSLYQRCEDNKDELIEMLTLFKSCIPRIYTDENMLTASLSTKSRKHKDIYYSVIIRSNLTKFYHSLYALQKLAQASPELVPLIEEDIFLELKKAEDKANPFNWDFQDIYAIMSGEGKAKLLRGLDENEFVGKLELSPADLHKLFRDKTPKEVAAFLEKCPAHWAEDFLLGTLAQHQPSGNVENTPAAQFAAAFLTLYYRAQFIDEEPHSIKVLLALFYQHRAMFFISDDEIDSLLKARRDFLFTMTAHEINRFILHALSVTPKAWSPTFRAVFSLAVKTLRHHLTLPPEQRLNLPLCIPEFIFNLSGLVVVARVCINYPDNYSEVCRLLDFNDKHPEENRSMFFTSYLTNCIHPLTITKQFIDADIFRHQVINDIYDELPAHIRTTNDIRLLFTVDNLREEQHESIYYLGLELLEKNRLIFDEKVDADYKTRLALAESVNKSFTRLRLRLSTEFSLSAAQYYKKEKATRAASTTIEQGHPLSLFAQPVKEAKKHADDVIASTPNFK